MGVLSKIGNAIKSGYNKVDQKVGGYLPGGSTPQQVSQSKSSSPSQSSSAKSPASSAPQGNAPTNSTSSRSSGGSSGVTTISGINLPPQSNTPLPYQTRGTATDLAPQVPNSVKAANASATYGGGGGNQPASAPATGASGNALNQGGGPASPTSGGSSGGSAVITAAPENSALQRPYDPAENMSVGEKLGYVFRQYTSRDFYSNVGQQAFGAGNYQSPKPVSAFGSFLAPLQVFAPGKTGDIKSQDLPYSGTGIYNPSTGQYEVPQQFKGRTTFERLQEQAFLNPDLTKPAGAIASQTASQVVGELKPTYETKASGIAAEYQGKINAGTLTVEQATPLYQADLAKLQSQYEAEATRIYTERVGPKVAASQQFSQQFNAANRYAFNIPTLGTTAALIGASFAGGSAIAGVRAVSGIANAAVAVEGGSNFFEGVSNKNYVQAAVGAGLLALGTYGALKYAANEVTIAQLEGVRGQTPRLLYGSRTELSDNYFQDIYGYKQATSSAKAVTRETVFSRFNPQTNTFNIVSGSSETTIRTVDFWTGRNLYVGSYSTFTGSGIALPQGVMGAKSGIPGISVSSEGWTGSLSEIKSIQQYSYTFFDSLKSTPSVRLGGATVVSRFGAETQLKDGLIYSKSGALQQLPYKKIVGEGFTALEKQPGIYTQDTFGILKYKGAGSPTTVYFEPFPNTGLRGNIPPASGGSSFGGTSFAGASQGASQAAALQSSFSIPALSGQILKDVAIPASASAFAVPALASVSAYYGTGQYERTETYQQYFQAGALQSAQLQQMQQPTVIVTPTMIQSGEQIPLQTPFQGQIPSLGQVPGLDLSIPNGFSPGSPGPGPFSINDFPFVWFPGLKGFEGGNPGGGIIPSRKTKTRYTPDFASLVYRITGRQAFPTGKVTDPFKQRPIPKGYSFAFSEGPSFQQFAKNLPEIQQIKLPKRRRF